ncbi:MAG: UDP-N-acetylmuramoyl-tripeptide--D-alanyl-D-alanine ligase [Rhodobacteraceae bacterium]|nr:UDP-N-acetylmuramoyl-tripeptide--D-alanyl-D-alanine ligase [Paracoccaceae bacterium]
MTLWSAAEAAAATGGRAIGNWCVDGVSIDTRSLRPGDLFVALKAARDGHDFVARALEQGAGAALVSRIPDGVAPDAPLLVADDALTALEDLGRAARARTAARVVAVTGSVGKTSTKEMLATVLAAQGRTHASVASYNNHWGVPLTLARMPRDTEFAVIEIGMNHPGEIAPLARQARPHVVIVTTVGSAHLEAFDDVAGIAREKASIVEGLEPGGLAVLNGDVETAPLLRRVAAAQTDRILSFGESAGVDYRALEILQQDQTTVVRAQAPDMPLLFKIAAPGRHFGLNALALLAAVDAMGVDPALAVAALGRWRPVAGRGARETVALDPARADSTLDLIDDAYNANPVSMAAALEVLAASRPHDRTGRFARGRRIAFLGDMKELGPEAPALHAGLADLPALASVDVVHCIGPLMRALHRVLPDAQKGAWAESAAEILPNLRARVDAGDVVLVKGSLSMKLGQVVDAIRKMGHGSAQPDRNPPPPRTT